MGGTPMIIAIDGPAASGKGTLGKRIADRFGLAPPRHRPPLPRRCPRRDAARRQARRRGGRRGRRAQPRSRHPRRSRAARPGRRGGCLHRCRASRRCGATLRQFQRDFARRPAGAVLDGRDIGTVVCPDADVKIYVTATPEVRARRRHLELQGRGEATTYEAVLADIRRRDERDAGPRGVAHAARRRRLLAGYQQFGYRSGIRHRCRRDPKEGRPARACLRAPLAIQLAQGSAGGRTHTSWARGLGPAGRAGNSAASAIRPLDAAPNRKAQEQE